MPQLKTFNVVEKYEEILPFLDSKKNQSGFICELILSEMRGERVQQTMSELSRKLLESSTALIREEIRKGIREEIREEIRIELRTEFKDFKRDFLENLPTQAQAEDICNTDL